MRPVAEMCNADLRAAFKQALREETVCLIADVKLAEQDQARLDALRAEMKRRGLTIEETAPRERWPRKGV